MSENGFENEAAAAADAAEVDASAEYGPGGGEGEVEPGAEGPAGTGVEGADAAFELERREDENAQDRSYEAPDFPDELGEDLTPAAEQGNRDGDEMVAEGQDEADVAELSGDTLQVDALEDDGITPVADDDGLPQVADSFSEEDAEGSPADVPGTEGTAPENL